MKKLMIAACAVALAAVANAGTCYWGTDIDTYVYKPETNTKLGSTYTALLFDATAYDQTTLLADFRGDGYDSTKVLNTIGVAGGEVYDSKGFGGLVTDQHYNLYFAIIDSANDQIFITTDKLVTGPDVNKSVDAYWDTTKASKAAALETGYAGMGWYTAVPEPTSGLLLLLGVAGLALRRRRA